MRIEFDGVVVEADGTRILGPLSLTISERRVAVLGENGSGKSTFLRCLNGLATPSYGFVRVGGFDTVDEPATIRAHVSLVLANPDSQILMPTIGEDIDLSLATARRLRHKRPDSQPIPGDARQVLSDFGIDLEPDRAVSTLSGGQKQLVAFASVLATKPQLLLCDEPTTRLDLGWRAAISQLLLELPVPTVIATHDLELANQCQRALVIHDGVVAWDGNPAEAIDFYSDLMSRRRTVQHG